MTTQHRQYHVHYSPPSTGWKQGCWALYEITGDEIARRIGYDTNGAVVRRDSWPGYVGSYGTLALLTAAIEQRNA